MPDAIGFSANKVKGQMQRQRKYTIVLGFIFFAISIALDFFWDRSSGRSTLQVILTYAMTFVVLTGLFVGLVRSRSHLTHTVRNIELQRVLKHQLAGAYDWDELVSILLQYPRTLVPLVGDCLLVFDPEIKQYKRVGEWSEEGKALPWPEPVVDTPTCSLHVNGSDTQAAVYPCVCLSASLVQAGYRPFCLPLVRGSTRALLYFCLPQDGSLTEQQASLLSEVALDMALAIERARLEVSIHTTSAATRAEQDQLARTLHDTLGHDLAYLRLKLEQISSESFLSERTDIRRDLERMQDVANQSYEYVRYMLSNLREEVHPDLGVAVQECALYAGDRADFSVNFKTSGEPRDLAPRVQRQVLYITREILRNVEKHAQASQVQIDLDWGKEDLTVKISDDGKGFSPEMAADLKGHYGLKMIKEVAAEFNGTLDLKSEENRGAQFQLRLPLESKS